MSRPPVSHIVNVADRILADIRQRRLKPGDLYPGTADTAKSFRVSGSTVNRAFQLLAQRGVVERRQRRGTIVLDSRRRHPLPLQQVHLLIREDHLRQEGLWAEGVLLGLQQSLPGVTIQFTFRPSLEDEQSAGRVLDQFLRSRQSIGLVLFRSGVALQRLVQSSGLPAVVSGTLQPSIHDLPSVDRDQARIGELMADWLIQQKCRTMLVLMRERMAPGDHLMLDSALQTFAQHRLTLNQVSLRFLPADAAAIQTLIETQLQTARGTVGCLCRSERIAGVLRSLLASERWQHRARQLRIIVADATRQTETELPYPCIVPESSPHEFGRALGTALLTELQRTAGPPIQTIVPVRLVLP
jgi:DNA-binding transcriptional regulator YhcF (GntR family)/DNA-binding LacI/PurR family transcriptional regulator